MRATAAAVGPGWEGGNGGRGVEWGDRLDGDMEWEEEKEEQETNPNITNKTSQ